MGKKKTIKSPVKMGVFLACEQFVTCLSNCGTAERIRYCVREENITKLKFSLIRLNSLPIENHL